jgi:hypothetical protein
MYFPQLDTPTPPSRQPRQRTPNSGISDWCILAVLWLFSATLGPFCGYLPPRFKPFWLSQAMLVSIFLSWIGIGTLVLLHDKPEDVNKGVVVFCFVAAVAGLGNLLFGSESSEKTSESYRDRSPD